MRITYKSSAVVLHGFDYGETDRILTFYTADFGKLKGIAKGARRSKKRFMNALEPFCVSTIFFSKKATGTLALIEGCDVKTHNAGIRENLEKTLTCAYITDLVDTFTVEGKKNSSLFQLLTHVLSLINEGNPSETLTRIFEIRLLTLSGYEPLLDSCVGCKTPLTEIKSPSFIPAEGGITCSTCHKNVHDGVSISPGTLKSLILGKNIALEKISRVAFSPQIVKESGDLLERFIHHLVGREIKSLKVLHQIRTMVSQE